MFTTVTENPTQTQTVTHDVESLAGRLLKLSLIINIIAPAALFLVVYLLKSMEVLPSSLVPSGTLQIIFFAFLFVAVSEVVVAFIIKKSLFSPDKIRPTLTDSGAFAKLMTAGTITLAALGGASMFYGILLYILGSGIANVAAFALIALVHFRLFRPTADFLRSLVAQAS